MSGHFNTQGNLGLLKTKFNQNLAAGEKLMGFEYEMVIDGYNDLTVLIRSSQMPALGREDVEDFGEMGMKFSQYGALQNSGQIAVTAVETITGRVLSALKEVVTNKKYVNITIRATPESMAGNSAPSLVTRLLHCKFASDAIDLSTEDTTALVKPSINITYNWIDNLDSK